MAERILTDLDRSGIYQIVNKANGKRYIGSAKCFKVRWRAHLSYLNRNQHHSRALQRAWNLYGKDSFEFEIISYVPVDRLIDVEQIKIDSLRPEYNVCKIAGSTAGRKTSDETKALLSKAITGKKRSEETKARMREAWKYRKPMPPMSLETRRKISALHKGKPKPRTKEHQMKIAMTKRKISDDQVLEIRKLLASGSMAVDLAKRFGCSESLISQIKSGKKRVI